MREALISRRALLASGVTAAGYALAAKPILAAAIQTSETGLATGTVEIPVAGGSMRAFFAAPEATPSPPLALVVHEIFGIHEYIRDVCRRLAKSGYFAIAPDLYQRHGDVSTYTDVDAIIQEIVMSVPDAEVMADLDATVAWVKQEQRADVDRTVITGFCWGGRIVWLYGAHSANVRAGAAWYGRLEGADRALTPRHPLDVAKGRLPPIIGFYGTEDSGIPVASVERMREALTAAEQSSEIVLFPGAPHGFHADYRPSYREMAATVGWQRMLDWFAQHAGKSAPT
jgi:carboxymethylenebutenolidase